MYMQEALEAVCKKRKLNPNEYALLVKDMSILIPLDRTVASLEGKSELLLVKRSWLPRYGIVEKSTRTTDPNGKPSFLSPSTKGWLTGIAFSLSFLLCSFDFQEDVRNSWSTKRLFCYGLHGRLQGMIGESRTSLRVLTWILYPRNMLSPGSCPCLWEDTRGFWRSMGLTST